MRTTKTVGHLVADSLYSRVTVPANLTPRARRLRAARINLLDARMLLAFGDVPGAIVSLLNADRWRTAARVVR